MVANPGFGMIGFTEAQYKAAAIFFMVAELAAIGGTNYLATLNTTLIDDANTLVGMASVDQMRSATLTILQRNAIAAGASVPDTLNGINALTSCCFQSTDQMDNIMLLLMCKLGTHKLYPQ